MKKVIHITYKKKEISQMSTTIVDIPVIAGQDIYVL